MRACPVLFCIFVFLRIVHVIFIDSYGLVMMNFCHEFSVHTCKNTSKIVKELEKKSHAMASIDKKSMHILLKICHNTCVKSTKYWLFCDLLCKRPNVTNPLPNVKKGNAFYARNAVRIFIFSLTRCSLYRNIQKKIQSYSVYSIKSNGVSTAFVSMSLR